MIVPFFFIPPVIQLNQNNLNYNILLCWKASSSISGVHAGALAAQTRLTGVSSSSPKCLLIRPQCAAALVLPHLIAADVHSCLNTLCGSTTLQLSFRNHFSVVINAALVSSVPLKMQLCLWVKGQTVHQRSMITNQSEIVTGSRRGARTENVPALEERHEGRGKNSEGENNVQASKFSRTRDLIPPVFNQ